MTGAAGRSLSFTYGDSKNLKQATAIADAVGVAASYTYDNASRLLQVQYADTTVNSYVYDSNGLITSVLDNRGSSRSATSYRRPNEGHRE